MLVFMQALCIQSDEDDGQTQVDQREIRTVEARTVYDVDEAETDVCKLW